MENFQRFVRKFVRKNFTPLSPDTDLTFDTWIAAANYPDWRKDELKRIYSEISPEYWLKEYKWRKIKAFVKEESYPTYKAPRGIYSRSDPFKIKVGPLIRAIEQIVFKYRAFVKKIPVDKRAAYIRDLINVIAGDTYVTDFESLEASVTADLMRVCEFELYDWMVSNNTEAKEIMEYFKEVVSGTNMVEFKYTTFEIDAKRMSGEMNTSLGNGFLNLMAILYVCKKKKIKTEPGVEGDDGVFKSPVLMVKEDFLPLGLKCTMVKHDDYTTSSFCGLIFDPANDTNISDPIKIILKTPWLGRSYIDCSDLISKQLLKARALSMLWTYPGAPIIQSYAKYLLRQTYFYTANFRDFDRRVFADNDSNMIELVNLKDMKEKFNIDRVSFNLQLHKTPYRDILMSTRYLMAKVFGISPDEQIYLEKFFDSKDDLLPYFDGVLYRFVKPDQIDFYERFTFDDEVGFDGKFVLTGRYRIGVVAPYTNVQQLVDVYDTIILNGGMSDRFHRKMVRLRCDLTP